MATETNTILNKETSHSWGYPEYPIRAYVYFDAYSFTEEVDISKTVNVTTVTQGGYANWWNGVDQYSSASVNPSVTIYKGNTAVSENIIENNLDSTALAQIRAEGYSSIYVTVAWSASQGNTMYQGRGYFDDLGSIPVVVKITSLEKTSVPVTYNGGDELEAVKYNSSEIESLTYNGNTVY